MNVEGHAFKPDEKELAAARVARYNEIKHLLPDMEMVKSPQYGKTVFSGTLKTEASKALSEEDIALIADRGNLCFGGYCSKSGERFSGAYFID